MLNARSLRREILTMAYNGQAIHIGPAFSIVEIFAVLYNSFHNQENHIILSKGHGVMTQYACLEAKGLLDRKELENYLKDGSHLKSLADSSVKEINVNSGSLGHGLSIAVGMAFASKIKQSTAKTFCIVGDGESNEGSVWEAIMFASHNKLDDLVIIIDSNKFQAMGETVNVINMLSLKEKFISFGFDTLEIDGHDEVKIEQAIHVLHSLKNGKPKALIANTVKGKGITFMENNNEWHYLKLNKKQYEMAMLELS